MLAEDASIGAFHHDELIGMTAGKLGAKYRHFEESLPQEIRENLPPVWMQLSRVRTNEYF